MSTDKPTSENADDLIANNVEANQRSLEDTTTSLLETLTYQLEYERARNILIVRKIEGLLNQRVMPTPQRLRRALYPLSEQVEGMMQLKRHKG